MARFARVLLCAILIGTAPISQAADDDLNSSAYLVFDPETGEFITVHDPNLTGQSHMASDPAGGVSNPPPGGNPVAGDKSPLAAALVLAVGLLAAAVRLQSRRRKTA